MRVFWRKIHFFSTLIAGVFIFLASVTGCILAIEPLYLQMQSVSGKPEKSMTFGEFQEKLSSQFIEIFSLEKDAYGSISVQAVSMESDDADFFVDARTAEVVTPPNPPPAIFGVNRDFHRSLFLKTPGRILMGFTSFVLVLLVVSGLGLQWKRAGGWSGIWAKITVLDYKRDGHAKWSRIAVIPVFLIAASGVYLSVDRFVLHKFGEKETESDVGSVLLSELLLDDVEKVTFPISEEEEWLVETKEAHLYFDATTLQCTKKRAFSSSEFVQKSAFRLHTGEANPVWAFFLFLSSLLIVYLSFTGFQLVLERFRQRRTEVCGVPDDVEILLVVGSETGHTWRFADALEKALRKEGKKVYAIGFEQFTEIQKMIPVLFLTSTYGKGEAPENAREFISHLPHLLKKTPSIPYAVLGFGAKEYPDYCAFAKEIRHEMIHIGQTNEIVPFATVDNQSVTEFMDWVYRLEKAIDCSILIDEKQLIPQKRKQLVKVYITQKKQEGDVFLLHCTSKKLRSMQSGDLLGVYPPHENRERYYSMAVLSKTEFVLVIKRTGLCSTYLTYLKTGDYFEAFLKINAHFHLPTTKKPVILIANGTGIAPFLGMQSDRSHLFWGGKKAADFSLFENFCEKRMYSLALSREGNFSYVQNLLENSQKTIQQVIDDEGFIYICGSLIMLESVLHVLMNALDKNGQTSVEILVKQGRIRIDCY